MGDREEERRFGVTDNSVTAPVLQGLVSKQVLRILPAGYTPNALTLTGGSLALLSCLIIWGFMDEMRAGTGTGQFWMMTSALLLIIYGVFDQLDGMQARKTGRSSPFGDFLDHWVDTIIANSLTLPFMVMLAVEPWMIWLMMFITALAFWAHNWETRNINYRNLPLVGGLESIWTALAIMSVTAIFGIGVWQTAWFGVSLLQIFYWLGFSALAWVVIKSLVTSRTRLADYSGFLLSVVPVSIWLLLIAPTYSDAAVYAWLTYIAMGMMATLMTGNLMRHLWIGGEYQRFDAISPLLGLAMLATGLLNWGNDAISVLEQGVAVLTVFTCIARVVYQGTSSYRQISTSAMD